MNTTAVDPKAGKTLVFAETFAGKPGLFTSPKWALYSAVYPHWERNPSQLALDRYGNLVVTAKQSGSLVLTGGLAALFPFTYGYVEARVKTDADPAQITSAVLILWPDTSQLPGDGEIDYQETGSAGRNPVGSYIHYGGAANNFVGHQTPVDATRWHIWGCDWAPDHITVYVDGVPVWTVTDPAAIPTWAMHPTIQLDALAADGVKTLAKPVRMMVDYLRVWQATTPPPPDPYAVAPPIPPQPYTIPAGATVLPAGHIGPLTVTGPTYAPSLGATIIDGDVNFISGELHGVVVNGTIHADNNTGPPVVIDSWVHAQGKPYAIYNYRPNGAHFERLVLDGFTNTGLDCDDNNMHSTVVIKRVWDMKATGGNQGGATHGTGEVAVWIGHPVADGVQRVEASGGYTAAIWRGNAHANTAWSDIKATNDVGPGTAWYDEHQTTNCQAERCELTGEPNAATVYNAEWHASFAVGALKNCSFDHFTVTGGKVGMDFEPGSDTPVVTNTRFIGQTVAGIQFNQCVNPSQSGNDFSGLAPGAVPVVTT